MAGDNTTMIRDYKKNLDAGIAGVMPDHWEGHGRLAIRESDVIPTNVEEKAIEKMNNLTDKKNITPERAANNLIAAIQKKRQE